MAPDPDPVGTEVFRHLFISVAEEMGVTLERTAFSPNIKERRDHSCAVFDVQGALLAQAAHIPVHLGAFPLLMEQVVRRFSWRRGDVLIANDPFAGGTHLPDISFISPVFTEADELAGFVANRAHHADVGGTFAGSMGPGTDTFQEGLIIPPVLLFEAGERNEALYQLLCRNVRTPEERRGDLAAQLAANATGVRRFEELLQRYGAAQISARAEQARRRARAAVDRLLDAFPARAFCCVDYLDDDGQGAEELSIHVEIAVQEGLLDVDFRGTAPQQKGCVNATLAVTHAAVYYALISLLGPEVPINAGIFDRVRVSAPAGTLVNAQPPAAVAAGNVETSQRIVDVVLGGLSFAFPERVPASSQGTMNNISLGGYDPREGRAWTYYETLGGGAGGGPHAGGASGIHCHMSNTRNTPAEALEYHYPLRVRRYALREGSGGEGINPGGDGVIRELEVLSSGRVSLLTERRVMGPPGTGGGDPGSPGVNALDQSGQVTALPAKGSVEIKAGAVVLIETPGGGGWGSPPPVQTKR